MKNMKTWCVYIHTNKYNGKKYIGITSKQKPEHRWNGGRGYNENPHFRSAIQKYGWDSFIHEILFKELSEQEAKDTECRLIRELRTVDPNFGYNMTFGGDGMLGYSPSEETRSKLSFAHRKENLSRETLERRSAGLRGRKFSDEHKAKIGRSNSKSVHMLDSNGAVVRSFSSAHIAEETIGVSHSHISQCCHGHRKTAGRYSWSFA